MPDAFRFAYHAAAADLRAVANAARRAGFDGLTLDAAKLNAANLSQSGRREVRAVIARHDLAAAALRSKVGGAGLTADADANRFLSELHAAMTLARDCGFSLVACDLGRLPRAEVALPPRKPIDPATAGLILLPDAATVESVVAPTPLTPAEREHAGFAADVLREAGKLADRVGTPVAFGASLATTADLIAVLRAADCPLFGRELDAAATIDENLEQAVGDEPAVLHVRACDARRGTGNKTQPAAVGEGDVDWPQALSLLRDADYCGFLTLGGTLADASVALGRLRAK